MKSQNIRNFFMKRALAFITFLLIIFLIIPSSNAVYFSNLSSCNSLHSSEIRTGENKSDLIIEDIITEPYNVYEDKFLCRVKNVGNGIIPGEEIINVDITVKRLFLGIFPIRTVRSFHVGGNYGDGLHPGEALDILFAYESYLPTLGIYRYNCVVNHDHSIEESDYDNNFFSKTYNAFFGYP